MPTTENQKKAQSKYLANPENKKKKNEWNAQYKKEIKYKYEPTEEQKERYKIYALNKRKEHQEKIRVCEELLKYDEIQKFMARMKEKEINTVNKIESTENHF